MFMYNLGSNIGTKMLLGGGTWELMRIPRENGQILILKNYFWELLRNGKIVYYQDVLQLPVPLNTLHTIHLNAKSHNLL